MPRQWLTIDSAGLILTNTAKMPAINTALVARETFSTIAKRENWAQKEAGVVVVFAIVFVVAVGLIGLFISRKISAARARKAGNV